MTSSELVFGPFFASESCIQLRTSSVIWFCSTRDCRKLLQCSLTHGVFFQLVFYLFNFNLWLWFEKLSRSNTRHYRFFISTNSRRTVPKRTASTPTSEYWRWDVWLCLVFHTCDVLGEMRLCSCNLQLHILWTEDCKSNISSKRHGGAWCNAIFGEYLFSLETTCKSAKYVAACFGRITKCPLQCLFKAHVTWFHVNDEC